MRKPRKQISKSVRFDVFNRDGFKCRYCGRAQCDGAVLHVDHKHPVAKGGTNEIENLVTACSDCNLGKSAKSLSEAPSEAARPTFGLSFDADGGCQWQFVIESVSEHAAKLMTFSWIDGRDYEAKTVAKDFLTESCVLFADHGEFIEAANYWGDLRQRGTRRNPDFVRMASA